MQHETGHLVWEERPELHGPWAEARQKDLRRVSEYGSKEIGEDFAEAVLMYSLVVGTPCEATMKAAFPARYAILKEVFKNGFPKKGR